MKKHIIQRKNALVFPFSILFVQLFAIGISAQIRQVSVPQPESQDDYTWWYVTLGVLILGLVSAVFWKIKGRNTEKKKQEAAKTNRKERDRDSDSLDADKELEWLRKNQLILDNSHKKRKAKRAPLPQLPDAVEAADSESEKTEVSNKPLPVFDFKDLTPSKTFDSLPLSNNESLLSAIEQTQDEYEEDEEVRELAVKILAAFKNRNSVEALSQVALYDLSSALRSKAVSILVEFDHESVFESILMACADPTREVRAAAARGISRLSFDRADAWTRIAETGEEGRMRHAARAALEGGFVERSIDRLVHPDQKMAYEPFALLALLIKAGEVAPIFDAVKNHRDKNVKLAVLHLIKVLKNQNALNDLYSLLEDKTLPVEIKEEVDKTIQEISLVLV